MDDEIANPTPLPADRSPRNLAPADVGTDAAAPGGAAAVPLNPLPPEIGGPTGPEPTRYGDWERKGRCYDF